MDLDWLNYVSWGIAIAFLILEILERIGITDSILKKIVLGPYKYADQALIEAAEKCRKHFYLITGEADFIDEPWGEILLESLSRLKDELNYEVKIMIAGDPDAIRVRERIKRLKNIGFKDENDVRGTTERPTLFYYYIVGGLQAAAMNEKICLVKIDYEKGIKIKNNKNEEKWKKWFKIHTKSMPGKKEYKYVKRPVVREFRDSYLRELVEGYFHGYKGRKNEIGGGRE